MADGFVLNVDAKFLQDLEKADKKMSDLVDKSNALSKSVVESFNKISTQGVDPFLEKLKQQKNALEAIASIDVSKASSKGLKDLVKSTSDAVDQINKIINALQGSGTSMDVKNATKKVESEIKKETDVYLKELDKQIKARQEYLSRQEQVEQERVKITQNATKKVESEIKLENDAYLKGLNDRIRQAQEYQARNERVASERKRIESEVVKHVENEIKKEKDAHLKSLSDQIKTRQEYLERVRKLQEAQARKESEMRAKEFRRIQQYGDTSGQSMSAYNRLYGEHGIKSINNMNRALQRLQDAQNKLNLNTEEGVKKYAELDKRIQHLQRNISTTTNSINNMGKSHRGLMDTAGQLARKLALVFSVSQIQGYISKLIQVRGEFELQQKSLQVLLQSKDEADKLWQQTIDLAIRSPFRVKELVSYTRQLSAYRIETSKLHDTTKRLADVSAGLGVDMNRIILAFGQVRAANFLRGTELRQFTEAGIPMLDELAKLFTELEGRMVSAGDVFERISKRMVTFSDVEEVFTRMTNAGGVFYNMQEEQSKTLQGMISNLRDSIDLMLNDIGKANDGLLKGSVNTAKNFVENWKEVAFYMENAIKALVAWKIANVAFVVGTQKAATTTLWLNSALKANIGTSMINIQTLKWSETALVGVTKQQWLLGKATLYLQGILRGIGKFAIRTIVPLAAIAGVIELYRHLTKASRQAKELQNALNEIYNEDISNLEKQTKTFEDLVERLNTVNKGSKEHKDIISQLNSQYGDYLGFLVTEKTTYDELYASINSVTEALSQKAKAQTFEKSLSKIIENSVKEVSTLQNDIEKKISKIGFYRDGESPSIMPTEAELNDIFNLYEKKVREVNKLVPIQEVLSEYYGEYISVAAIVSDKFAGIGRQILQQKTEEDKLQQRLNGLYGEGVYSTQKMRDEMNALNEERKKALQEEKTRIGKEKIEYDYLVKKTRLEGKYQGLEQHVIDANVAKLQKTSETIRDINRRIIETTDELGAEAVDRVYITAQDASQGVNAIAESMAAGYKSMQEEITNQNALKEAGTVHDEASLENATKMSKAYYKVLEIMGRLDLLKSKGDKKESAIKILNNRINLIKEINKEYEKLNEKFDATTAKEQVLNAYKDTFKEAFEGTGIKFSGLVIDKEKLKIEGEKSGQIFSDEMVKKMNDVIASGTYIRSASDRFKNELKEDEGVMFQLYDDSTKKIINNTKDFQKAVGTVTIGWGHAIKDINEAAKYFGKTISEVEAQEIFDQDVNAHVQALNKVLDKYQDLILTQEQYDSLLNATFQGGGGMISSAISYAMDIDKGVKHFENLDIKLKKVGKTFEQEFGNDFISRFKNAETATERLALALETVGLTTVASGSNIDERLYKGMKKRSQERAAEFRGDLEIVKLLQKAAVDVSQIDFTNIRGVIATLKQLEPIAKKEGKEAQLQLSKVISKLEAEIGLDLKVKDDKALIDKIEDMFSGYEMSIELQKLNIPKDLAKQLFNVDSVDLSSIRNKISSELAKAQATGGQEDRVKELKKQLDKVEEMEDKAMQERLKKYTKYLVKAQGERVKIKMEELRQLNEIETLNFTESQKSMARMAIQQESRQKMDKLDWEEFKNSGMYVQLFEDLDLASTKALERMRKRLIEMKSSLKDLDADDLRNLYNQIEKLDNELATRNPYKHMIDGAKDYIEAIRESKRVERELDLQSQVTKGMQSKEVSLSEELAKQKTIYEQMSKSKKATKDDLDKQRLKISLLNAQLAAIKAQLAAQGKLTKELEEELDGYKATRKLFTGKAGEIGKDISEVANALPQIASELENVFGAMDAGTRDTIDSIATIGSGVGDAIQGFASGNYIQAVLGVVKAIGGIFQIGDKKKERQIQREIKFVEDLERAYQKLEKQIDKAYEFDTLKGSYDAAQKNIDAQIESYNKMIAAEEDKKKTDKDRIKEWELAIDELKEKQKEMLESQVEELGGSYDFSSITEEFVNAWLEAFKDTGNGLSGLEDNFEDFWKNIAIKQAVMGGASKIMQPLLDAVNKSLEDDFKLDDSEMANIDQLSAKAKEDMNLFLQQWYDRWGKFMGEGSQGELSGLQRGIQGVTEETAQIIEAYLNSIRFFVAEQNTYLSQIAASFGNSEVENPMVEQLRIIAAQTSAINSLLQGLVRGGHSLGGSGLKVFIS